MNKSIFLIITTICGLLLGLSQGCSKPISKSYSQIDSIQIFRELKKQLDSIYTNDQKYRAMLKPIEEKYGYESLQVQNHWKTIHFHDSVNVDKVTRILDTYGWLGSDQVGSNGNDALFLVIQHSNKVTMEKYLPMIKDAVKSGKASPQEFAMLTDRIEMLNRRPQIYGTQIQFIDGENKLYKVLDEQNINKRRSTVGLGPIEDYLKRFNISYKSNE